MSAEWVLTCVHLGEGSNIVYRCSKVKKEVTLRKCVECDWFNEIVVRVSKD